MGAIFDISMKITNELPSLKITDNLLVTINNRKNNILLVQAMNEENERKPEGERLDEHEVIAKALQLLVGESKAKAIEDLNLPIPEYTKLYRAIMTIAVSGEYKEETP